MAKYICPAVVLTVLLTILTGLIYPSVVTVLAQLIFPYQANGSLHYVNGKLVGSDLIGQYWTSSKYFHGRPSVTVSAATGSPEPYAADNSTASNLGPTNSQLLTGNGSEVTVAAGTPVTQAQIGDLEVLPRKNISYRGVTLEEMDTEAIIARHPKVALIDELTEILRGSIINRVLRLSTDIDIHLVPFGGDEEKGG